MTSRPRAAESFDIDFGGGNKKPPMCVIGHFRTLLSLHLFLEINLSSFSYVITSNVTVDQEVLCPPPLDQQLQALLAVEGEQLPSELNHPNQRAPADFQGKYS